MTWAHQHGQQQHRHAHSQCAGQQGSGYGWLLLGLGALFLLKDMGWMLFISALFGFLALNSYNRHVRRGQHRQGKRAAVWLLGIGLLIATGWWFPGIFIVWLIAANVH